jgi:PmbA protein
MFEKDKHLNLLSDLITRAKALGADEADAIIVESTSQSLTNRMGKQEQFDRSESIDLGLRVFVKKHQAIVSSSDLSAGSLAELVEQAIAMARVVPEDPFCGLAEAELLARGFRDVDICDQIEPTVQTLLERAREAEDAARAVPGVTNSEGAEAAWSRSTRTIVSSNGFAQAYSRSSNSLSACVLAGNGTEMERDYDFTTAVFAEDLRDASEVGASAGGKAVRRTNPQKVASGQLPVVYDPRVSGSLIGHLSAAANGSAIARNTSFLKDKLGQRIFPETFTVIDDPLRQRGLRSRPFDGEGIGSRPLKVIDKGVLSSWILDLRSARQLHVPTTGHAVRGTSAPPSPSTSNFYLEPGTVSPQDLMADIENGLYVTDLIGFGVNGVTGDYSRGASGFRIENGQITHPVSEVTIAGNLIDMFANATAADDLVFRYGTDCPTIRIDGMTIAGR